MPRSLHRFPLHRSTDNRLVAMPEYLDTTTLIDRARRAEAGGPGPCACTKTPLDGWQSQPLSLDETQFPRDRHAVAGKRSGAVVFLISARQDQLLARRCAHRYFPYPRQGLSNLSGHSAATHQASRVWGTSRTPRFLTRRLRCRKVIAKTPFASTSAIAPNVLRTPSASDTVPTRR